MAFLCPNRKGKFQSIRSAGGRSKISKHQNIMTQHGVLFRALFEWAFFLFESPLSVPPETQILIFMAVRSRQQFSDNQALL
jgi:hypothetical protein